MERKRGTTIIPREEIQRKHKQALARERGEELARDYARLPTRLEALDLAHRLATSDTERADIAAQIAEVRRALEARQ